MKIELTKEQVAQVVAQSAQQQLGQIVVDVGSGSGEGSVYTGPLDPTTLDVLDWAFYSRMPNLWAKAGAIFSSKPVPRDPVTGRDLHQGDLASADLSGYFAAGGKFGPYL